MVKEIWKDIPGYEGLYQASNLSRIRSLKFGREKILKQMLKKNGYVYVALFLNGKQKTTPVHRILASMYIPNPENKRTVNHINGIKTDNSIKNLEWATHSENHKHAYSMGLMCGKGEKGGNSKLTKAQVLEIRARLFIGECGADLGREFNVGRRTISSIKLRKTWSHI